MSEILNGKGYIRGHLVSELRGWTPDLPISACEELAAPLHNAITEILPSVVVNTLDLKMDVKCGVRSILALSPNQWSGTGNTLLQ